MKTAKEMFEELGWNLHSNGLKTIYFNMDNNETLEFNKEDEDYYVENIAIDMPLLKAIIQQCKELRWLDE